VKFAGGEVESQAADAGHWGHIGTGVEPASIPDVVVVVVVVVVLGAGAVPGVQVALRSSPLLQVPPS
jgi:hypothetical protein